MTNSIVLYQSGDISSSVVDQHIKPDIILRKNVLLELSLFRNLFLENIYIF